MANIKKTPDPMKVFQAIAWILSQREKREIRVISVEKKDEVTDKKVAV